MNNRVLKALRLIALPLSGALFALPVTFPSLSFLGFLLGIPSALLLFSALLREGGISPIRFFGNSFLVMTGFFLAVFHWFYGMYPLSFLGAFTETEAAFVVVLCHVGLSLLQSFFFALIFPLLWLLCRVTPSRAVPHLLPVYYAALYTVAEWAQNFTWAGVPWGTLALSQYESLPVLQWASLFGAHYISFVLVFVNGVLAVAILYLLRDRRARLPRVLAAVALATVLLHVGGGVILYAIPNEETATVRIGLIQHGISSQNGNLSPSHAVTVGEALIREGVAEGVTTFIWSETAFTTDLKKSVYGDILSRLSRTYGVTQYVGAFRNTGTGEDFEHKNVLWRINPDGSIDETLYAKRRLVPFGEYLPWRPFFEAVLPSLAKLMRDPEFTAGTDATVFEGDVADAGALICFDSIYPSLARDSVKNGADYLIVSTNDSWFSGTLALRQHNGHAVLRAVENGRSVARVAGTGISSFISAKGELLKTTEEDECICLIGDVAAHEGTTLYGYIGDAFIYLCIAFVTVTPLIFAIKRRIKQ